MRRHVQLRRAAPNTAACLPMAFAGGSAHLLWNAGCIAMVYRDRDGAWQTQIQWQRVTHRARCGSKEQGMGWIERWMEKRTGLPGSGSRDVIRQPAWMRAWQREVSGNPAAAVGHVAGTAQSRRSKPVMRQPSQRA